MEKVIIVILRRPRKNDPKETRTDPFWEFGSFGCTGCHRRNLLNPRRIGELEGARLAFVQGGHLGMRLVLLTPPIKTTRHEHLDKAANTSQIRCETKWNRKAKPFRYERAPLVISNDQDSDFNFLLSEFQDGDRTTGEARFASAFRSRRRPLPDRIANALIRRWDWLISKAPADAIARRDTDTLPYAPNVVDSNRRHTYKSVIKRLDGTSHNRCCYRTASTSKGRTT